MQNLGRISEGKVLSNVDRLVIISKNNYRAAPRRHLEPRDRSWQWAVRSGAERIRCKDLCVPKQCPKKSFFPRFKKAYIPVEKKSCIVPKKKETWKEYFSFLLPDPVAKPPLVQCRKLQAQRRECCGNPYDCGAYCLRDTCCPTPREWYGQAVVYEVPSSFPEPAAPLEPRPCAPPPPEEPLCGSVQKEVCPEQKKLNMDDYAYKKAFSGINVCDDLSKQKNFKCKSVCRRDPYRDFQQQKLTCGFSTDFRDVKCPESLPPSEIPEDLPPLVCKITEASKPPAKDINVEEKKGVCERTTFLKPYKFGEKYPGMGSRSLHTLKHAFSDVFVMQKSHYSSGSSKLPSVPEPSPASLAQSSWISRELPAFVQRSTFYQPSKSAMSLHSVLSKPMSSIWRQDSMFFPEVDTCRQYAATDRSDNFDTTIEIDPKLLALAEETRQKIKYADPPKGEERREKAQPLTLARKLSNETTKRMMQRAKDGLEDKLPTNKAPLPIGRNKLSLLRKANSLTTSARVTFMTDATDFNKRRQEHSSNKKKDKIICSGCSGILEAEREEECPSPKPLINCHVRPGGRCPGPERKLKAGEHEPDNPYYRNKAKPYSLCNKPRPIIKKEGRPYKMPCDQNQNRKIHTTSLMSESSPSFVTISEFIKTNGISMNNKNPNAKGNLWDSHTPDSYQERDLKGYDSVPDLGRLKTDDSRQIPLNSTFSSSSGANRNHFLKMVPDSISQSEDSLSLRSFKSPRAENNDWGCSTLPYDNEPLEYENPQESKLSRTEKSDSDLKESNVKAETSTINLWELPSASSQHKKPVKHVMRINLDENINEAKRSQQHELSCWSDGSPDKYNQNKESENRQTRFSALFNSNSKEKHSTTERTHKHDFF